MESGFIASYPALRLRSSGTVPAIRGSKTLGSSPYTNGASPAPIYMSSSCQWFALAGIRPRRTCWPASVIPHRRKHKHSTDRANAACIIFFIIFFHAHYVQSLLDCHVDYREGPDCEWEADFTTPICYNAIMRELSGGDRCELYLNLRFGCAHLSLSASR